MDRQACIDKAFQIPGQTWPLELMWLYDTFKESRIHAEIGVFCGRSLFASCGAMDCNATVVAVNNDSEAFDSDWSIAVRTLTYNMLQQAIRHLAVDSVDAALYCHKHGLIFDSVFIDASHDFHSVLADIEAWMPLVKPGGIISGHDYWSAHVGVMDAVNYALKEQFSIVPRTRIWFSRLNSR